MLLHRVVLLHVDSAMKQSLFMHLHVKRRENACMQQERVAHTRGRCCATGIHDDGGGGGSHSLRDIAMWPEETMLLEKYFPFLLMGLAAQHCLLCARKTCAVSAARRTCGRKFEE